MTGVNEIASQEPLNTGSLEEIARTAWHSPNDRMPTAEDADEQGWIAVFQPRAGFALMMPEHVAVFDPKILDSMGMKWGRIPDVVLLPPEAR